MISVEMQKALIKVGFGVRNYAGGYYPVDDPEDRLNIRTLNALSKRGLIDWRTGGTAPHYTELVLTDAGEDLFEELQEEVER